MTYDHTVQDIHGILESYYKVARKRFVDNVCMQAVDYYLVIEKWWAESSFYLRSQSRLTTFQSSRAFPAFRGPKDL